MKTFLKILAWIIGTPIVVLLLLLLSFFIYMLFYKANYLPYRGAKFSKEEWKMAGECINRYSKICTKEIREKYGSNHRCGMYHDIVTNYLKKGMTTDAVSALLGEELSRFYCEDKKIICYSYALGTCYQDLIFRSDGWLQICFNEDQKVIAIGEEGLKDKICNGRGMRCFKDESCACYVRGNEQKCTFKIDKINLSKKKVPTSESPVTDYEKLQLLLLGDKLDIEEARNNLSQTPLLVNKFEIHSQVDSKYRTDGFDGFWIKVNGVEEYLLVAAGAQYITVNPMTWLKFGQDFIDAVRIDLGNPPKQAQNFERCVRDFREQHLKDHGVYPKIGAILHSLSAASGAIVGALHPDWFTSVFLVEPIRVLHAVQENQPDPVLRQKIYREWSIRYGTPNPINMFTLINYFKDVRFIPPVPRKGASLEGAPDQKRHTSPEQAYILASLRAFYGPAFSTTLLMHYSQDLSAFQRTKTNTGLEIIQQKFQGNIYLPEAA